MNVEEITRYYEAGLLPIMIPKMKIPYDNVIGILLDYIEYLSLEVESSEKELLDKEDISYEVDQLNHELEVLQDECSTYKERNVELEEYISGLSDEITTMRGSRS